MSEELKPCRYGYHETEYGICKKCGHDSWTPDTRTDATADTVRRLEGENQHLKDLNAMLKAENTMYRQRPLSPSGSQKEGV